MIESEVIESFYLYNKFYYPFSLSKYSHLALQT